MAYELQIQQEALRQGVPPELALAVARRESGLNPYAVGAAGEVGLYQLMPGTALELGVNPAIPAENIRGGISYLRQQHDRFGSWDLALAAYNAGAGRVSTGSIPRTTQGYVADILGALGWEQGGRELDPTFYAQVTEGEWNPISLRRGDEGGNQLALALAVLAVGLLVVWSS